MATMPVAAARRASAGPTLVRLIAGLAGFGAAAVAAPPQLLEQGLVAFVIVAGLAAAAVAFVPRTRFVGTFLLGVVGLWLVATLAFDVEPSLARIGALAACLYLTHAAAALAAVLPYDALVPSRVLRYWAGRVATVLVAGVAIAVGGVAMVRLLTQVQSVVGPIVGSVVAAILAGVLIWQLKRS
jgi:hypothetical protein